MKALRFLLLLALSMALLACSLHARAQSPAQRSFAGIKPLAVTREGTLTAFPAASGNRATVIA